jgi:hypothetical protein
MKKILLILSLSFVFAANQKISELTTATTLNATDAFVVVQDGATKQTPYSSMFRIVPSSITPNAVEGQLWYRDGSGALDNHIMLYNGTQWVRITHSFD